MMTPRETWTDARLDDLNQKVEQGFAKVDKDIRELRHVMFQGFFALATIQATGFAALVAVSVF